jgi:hypothetical protein
MGSLQGGMSVEEETNRSEVENQSDPESVVNDEVAAGIIRNIKKGRGQIAPEEISYFQSIPDEDLDLPGLEVPVKED